MKKSRRYSSDDLYEGEEIFGAGYEGALLSYKGKIYRQDQDPYMGDKYYAATATCVDDDYDLVDIIFPILLDGEDEDSCDWDEYYIMCDDDARRPYRGDLTFHN